jgi:hypothetical protein
MGFVVYVVLPGMWVGGGFLLRLSFSIHSTYLAQVAAGTSAILFLMTLNIIAFWWEECVELAMFLLSCILLPIRLVTYILSLLLLLLRFVLLLLLSLFLPLLFFAYFGLYLLVSSVPHLLRFLLSSLLSITSKICIVRGARYRQSTLGSHCVPGCNRLLESQLCPTCDLLVESSSLLIGTRWLFTHPVEKHLHHTASDLETSAKSCALCHLLLFSVKSAGHSIVSDRSTQYGSIARLESAADRLTVRLWEQRSILERPLLRIQLIGNGFESKSLAVGQVHNGTERIHTQNPVF